MVRLTIRLLITILITAEIAITVEIVVEAERPGLFGPFALVEALSINACLLSWGTLPTTNSPQSVYFVLLARC